MTDNEKIKVLEDFIKHKSDGYQTYLAYGGKRDEAQENFLELMESFIEMFNRQKAEIELLTEIVQNLKEDKPIFFAETIKEFADNAKEELYEWVGADNSIPFYRIQKVIDNLVKEMVGDNNG